MSAYISYREASYELMYASVCSDTAPSVEIAVRYRSIGETDFNDWIMLSYITGE